MKKNREYKLPEVLRSLLKENNLSQQKLADKVQSTQGCVYSWISGRTLPSVYSLMALSNAFDVSIDYLIYGEKEGT